MKWNKKFNFIEKYKVSKSLCDDLIKYYENNKQYTQARKYIPNTVRRILYHVENKLTFIHPIGLNLITGLLTILFFKSFILSLSYIHGSIKNIHNYRSN